MKHRILVLDAQNFVGARVVQALEASDWATPIVGKSPLPSESDAGEVDAVVNCTLGSPQRILANAREAFRHRGRGSQLPLRVVHLSSMTVYGDLRGLAKETSAPGRGLNDYAAAHVAAEAMAHSYPNAVVLRCGCEYGPDCVQWTLRIARLLRAHRLGDLGVHGDGVCNLLFIDDLVEAIVRSVKLPLAAGTFNLAMRRPPSWNDYFIRFGIRLGAVPVSRITARRLKLERLLAPPLKVMEMAAQRLAPRHAARATAITPSLLQVCQQPITLDVTDAEEILGLRWTALDEGLDRAAAACGSG